MDDSGIHVRGECRRFWSSHAPVEARVRFRSPKQCWPILKAGVLLTLYFILLCIAKVIKITMTRVWRIHHRRVKWQTDRQLQRMTFKPVAAVKPSSLRSATAAPTGPFFSLLPAEVRRRILIYAFGDKTLHMDLRLRQSIRPPPGACDFYWPRLPFTHGPITWNHAGILTPGRTATESQEAKKRWRWYSCVCHRFPARGPDALPMGRRRNYPWIQYREPEDDLCLRGGGCCDEWPVDSCKLGIMGWLLSCRQSYVEGVEVLYRTNTLHIASHILIRGFQDIMAPQVVSSITSLELVWNPKPVHIEDGFTGLPGTNDRRQSKIVGPLFPSLKYLRISFAGLCSRHDDLDHAVKLPRTEDNKTNLSRQLHQYTLPAIDKVLDRIAPPSAEVTLSCRNWAWYIEIDLLLVESQGKEKTRPQRSEMEGLKCWRVLPTSKPADEEADGALDRDLEAGTERKIPRREGYWIHIPVQQIKLHQHTYTLTGYDQERHDLYDLGPGRYRYE